MRLGAGDNYIIDIYKDEHCNIIISNKTKNYQPLRF
jgi:hypothetical protein